ncbi:MAG TPA: nucleoside recognition domain-containing protein [Thermaerobacter sp.]
MWFIDAIVDGIRQGILLLLRVALFVTPVLILLEWAKLTGYLDRVTHRLEPLCRRFGLAPELAPSLTVGAVLGVILGSGVVLETSRDRPVARDQVTLLFVFVGIFHAMFEETAAVFAFGGNGLIMVTTRFAFGLAAFWAYRRWLALRPAALGGPSLAAEPVRQRG